MPHGTWATLGKVPSEVNLLATFLADLHYDDLIPTNSGLEISDTIRCRVYNSLLIAYFIYIYSGSIVWCQIASERLYE